MGRLLGPALALLLGLATAGCPNDIGWTVPPADDDDTTGAGDGDASDDPAIEDPYWCCDPDQPQCVCPGYWRCTEGFEGKVCRQSNPPLPDEGGDGTWVCEYTDDLISCEGRASEHPDAGADGDWECTSDAGNDTITCDRAAGSDDYPDEGGVGDWDCSFSSGNEARACHEGEVGGGGPDDGAWDCMTAADGQTICSNDNPEQPDDGDWRCFRRADGADVCEGDHVPDDGTAVGWDCTAAGEVVTCEKADGQLPDAPGEGAWDCTWNEVGLRCHDNPGGGGDVGGEGEGEGGGGDAGGGGGGGGGGDGDGGGGDAPGDDCTCIAGAVRFCDEPDYCLWGTQQCQEWFGARTWGPCEEANIPAGCAPGGALARDYDWNYAGGFWDNWQTRLYDADGDGILTYPPDFWFNPAGEDCAIRSGACAQDMWDLDQDLDNQESIGDCADIQECV